MDAHLSSAEGYHARVVSRSTGTFATHHFNSQDHELAMEWARRLAQSCRVELWRGARLVASFPPLPNRAAKHSRFQ